MRLVLAPMEGVVDSLMRQHLTQFGGFDLCVTEFIRVVDRLLPNRVFYRYCPELKSGGLTKSGCPVRVQLLGQEPDILAENGQRVTELGSHGVDLNFGCPAKTVNRSKGGAVLLKEPEQIYRIVHAVRQAVAPQHPVSAKVRLGYDDDSQFADIIAAVTEAGANELTVHARTKRDGYRPPAYWHKIHEFSQTSDMLITANGEVWDPQLHQQCSMESGCTSVMLGRGALASPNLAAQIKLGVKPLTWSQILPLFVESFTRLHDNNEGKYFHMRTKQWLGYLKQHYPQANELFEQIRTLRHSHEILTIIEQQRLQQ